jgi:hypothetical protein
MGNCEVVKVISPKGCVLNKSWGHWLLRNALQFIISMCQEIKKDLKFQRVIDSLTKKEVNIFDLGFKQLIVWMNHQVLEAFQPLISFLHAFHMKIRHNI